MRKRTVSVTDKMQKGYRYVRSAGAGRGFDPEFKPQLTPAQMLALGVFGGKYMTDCRREFPSSWFTRAKLSPRGYDRDRNFFRVDASQSLSEWKRKPRGGAARDALRLLRAPAGARASRRPIARGRAGPKLLAHGQSDGSFSFDDAQAREFARKQCPSRPPRIGGRQRDVGMDIGCALLWGVKAKDIARNLASCAPRPGEAYSPHCPDWCRQEKNLVSGFSVAAPPLRLGK